VKYLNLLLVAAFVLFYEPAWGDDEKRGCSVTVDSLEFGEYRFFDGTHLDTSGEIEVRCRKKTEVSVYLDAGQNSGGSFYPRKMVFGASSLSYNVYVDVLKSKVWGDGTSGTFIMSDKIRKGEFKYYARIPAGQNVASGVYTDVIIITVVF